MKYNYLYDHCSYSAIILELCIAQLLQCLVFPIQIKIARIVILNVSRAFEHCI